MHISRPITLPESVSAQRRSEHGVVAAVILFVLVALGGSLWLAQNGVTLACGEQSLTTTCGTP